MAVAKVELGKSALHCEQQVDRSTTEWIETPTSGAPRTGWRRSGNYNGARRTRPWNCGTNKHMKKKEKKRKKNT